MREESCREWSEFLQSSSLSSNAPDKDNSLWPLHYLCTFAVHTQPIAEQPAITPSLLTRENEQCLVSLASYVCLSSFYVSEIMLRHFQKKIYLK